MTLTFEYGPANILEITMDPDGLEELKEVLARLTVGDHEHLFTPSWGGYPLTEDFPNPDLEPIHQVTISLDERRSETPE